MKKYIVTKKQLMKIFEEGFSCSAEGFNNEYGLEYNTDTGIKKSLLKHDVSFNDYKHSSALTYMQIFEILIKNFKIKGEE